MRDPTPLGIESGLVAHASHRIKVWLCESEYSTETRRISSLRNGLFEEDDGGTRGDPVDVHEVLHGLVLRLLHVQAVHRADVHALLAPDALRVVELGDHDRLPLPEVRAVDHVDAAGRTLALALAAPDAHIDLHDRFLADPVHDDDLLVALPVRHLQPGGRVVSVFPGG